MEKWGRAVGARLLSQTRRVKSPHASRGGSARNELRAAIQVERLVMAGASVTHLDLLDVLGLLALRGEERGGFSRSTVQRWRKNWEAQGSPQRSEALVRWMREQRPHVRTTELYQSQDFVGTNIPWLLAGAGVRHGEIVAEELAVTARSHERAIDDEEFNEGMRDSWLGSDAEQRRAEISACRNLQADVLAVLAASQTDGLLISRMPEPSVDRVGVHQLWQASRERSKDPRESDQLRADWEVCDPRLSTETLVVRAGILAAAPVSTVDRWLERGDAATRQALASPVAGIFDWDTPRGSVSEWTEICERARSWESGPSEMASRLAKDMREFVSAAELLGPDESAILDPETLKALSHNLWLATQEVGYR